MYARSPAFLWSCMLPGLLFCGCAKDVLSPLSGLPGTKPAMPAATPEEPVVRVVAIWQTAEGVGLDNQPARGFAGQLYFFTANRKSPVKVDGKVRIYEFDDIGTPEEQTKPIHQFDFPAEVWKAYLTETQLGPAYEIFIPYVREGNHEAQCALRVRYTPESGPSAYSDLQTIQLVGAPRSKKAGKTSQAKPGEVTQQNEAEKSAEAEEGTPPTKSATIRNSRGQITPEKVEARLDRWKEQIRDNSAATPQPAEDVMTETDQSSGTDQDERLKRIEATLMKLLSEPSAQKASREPEPAAGGVQQSGYFEEADVRQSRETPHYVSESKLGGQSPPYVSDGRPRRHAVRHPLADDVGEEPRLFPDVTRDRFAEHVNQNASSVPQVESRAAFEAHSLAAPEEEPHWHPLAD